MRNYLKLSCTPTWVGGVQLTLVNLTKIHVYHDDNTICKKKQIKTKPK